MDRRKSVHWLEMDPRTARTATWLEYGFYAVFVVMTVGALLLWTWMRVEFGGESAPAETREKVDQVGVLLLLACAVTGLLIYVVRLAVRALKRRLGSDGQRVHLKLEDGREWSVDPSGLFYTRRAILYGEFTFPLQGGQQRPLYAEGEFEQWIEPLLQQAEKLNEWQVLRYQLRHRSPLVIWLVVLTALMAAVLLGIQLWLA
jgi:hypothetical protein